MNDADRVTLCKVVWEARREGGMSVLRDDDGAQHNVTVKDPAALAALIPTLRRKPDSTFEPSSERLYSGDWRPVGWIRRD